MIALCLLCETDTAAEFKMKIKINMKEMVLSLFA
jgi:hypothetical protein